MKQYYIVTLCAAALFALACEKEQDSLLPAATQDAPEGITVLTAGIETTKTVLDGTKALWTNGNQIKVNGTASNVLSLTEPAATVDFTFGSTLDHPYKAIYPASAYTGESTITLPYSQTYTAGSFADDAAAMYAYTTEGSNLSFKHLMCIVKVSVTRAASDPDTHDIKYVEFKSKGSERVSGLFSIDYTTGELTASGDAGETDGAVRVTGSVSTASGADFYIAVPAQTYASGFTVKVCDSEGHYMEKSKNASTTLEAGHIHPMASFEFVPTRTELISEIITSAAELTAFATKWNTGKYDSADVSLGNDFAFSADEAAAYPGIGTWDCAFNGTFDGKGYTITGYNATVPLFTRTSSDSVVKDFTLNGTMSAQPSEIHDIDGTYSGSYLGSISGYHRGSISGVTSNVSIEILNRTYDDASKVFVCVGGLVGSMVSTSTISSCNYGGTITDASDFTGGVRTYIGGIIGRQNNKNCVVSDCQLLAGGAIDLDATVASVVSRYNVGGISGRMDPGQITGSTNNGTVTVSVSDGITGATYTYVGGISGATSANSSYSNLSNNGSVIINMAGYAATQPLAVGGIIGVNSIELTGAENITNTASSIAKVNGTAAWDAFTKDVDLGGIFGRNSASVDGLTNKGLVTYVDTDTDGSIIGDNLYMGGVIGAQTAGTVSNCTNEGEVHFDVNRGTARAYDSIYYGGVVGYSTAAITVDHCSNSGYVHGGVNLKGSSGVSYVGGIAGYVQGSSTVSNCSNTGAVTNRQRADDDKVSSSSFLVPYIGGIVGGVQGASAARASISNCSVPSSSLRINSRRGASGGIVGYIQYGDVSDCTFESHIDDQTESEPIPAYNSYAYYVGGICAVSSYAKFTGCTVRNASLKSTMVYYIGGILALGYNATEIDGCHFLNGAISTSSNVAGIGAITGFVQKSGANKGTIKNCTYSGTLAGNAMTEPGEEGTSVSGTSTGIGIGNGTLDNNHLAE